MVCGVAAMWPWGEATLCQAIFTIAIFLADMAAPHHFRRLCHPNYYKWPNCVDHPDGYSCECGPGFFWNNHMCVALGIDSRLEFSMVRPVRYTLLRGKAFPELKAFSIGLWMKLQNAHHPGTIISYKHNNQYNVIRLITGPTLRLKVHDQEVDTQLVLNTTTWFQMTCTWTSTDGSWHLFISPWRVHVHGVIPAVAGRPIPAGGELVLGQSSRTPASHNYFDLQHAFLGEMGFVNIWGRPLEEDHILQLHDDCEFTECGDAIEWADFRAGTRGAMRLRWPSQIMSQQESCIEEFATADAGKTCDKYCSHVIGAQCAAEVRENIVWERTPADVNVSVPCPGRIYQPTDVVPYANRSCVRTAANEGAWMDPVLDDCISLQELHLKNHIREMLSEDGLNTSQVMTLAESLLNQTAVEHYRNPIDIATIIDSVELLVKAQEYTLTSISSSRNPMRYTRTHPNFPQLQDAQFFAKTITGILDHLAYDRNSQAWLATQPPGAEGDELIKVLERFLGLIYHNLHSNIYKGTLLNPHDAAVSAFNDRLAFKTRVYRTRDMSDIVFPEPSDVREHGANDRQGTLVMPRAAIFDFNDTLPGNDTELPDYIGISITRLSVTQILPNHDIATKSQEDNVNSAIFCLMVHGEEEEAGMIGADNLTVPVTLHFTYMNNFNISNPACVRLEHGHDNMRWKWTREGCRLIRNTSESAICHCMRPGVFAVTTDMYDVNWDRGEEPFPLMLAPSYVGCSISALLCLTSFLMLIYLRTSSKTAAIHKNLAVAIICSQVTFMVGIDKFHVKVACQAFAIMFHYFFLATFSWLMNEAFNLYIVITYAAHSHGEHAESGSQWRYYILGWILPGVLVGAFVGTHTDDYYAPDMCWIAWQYIWLFLGPAIGIISVTILVLVFTAKEAHESAYAKNEQTNKMIYIHSKALWTQVILLVLCWFFAFLTLKMRGVIVKYLYALFNCLQGAFFLVFFFLLNEEVREVLSVIRKRKSMAKNGYEYSPTQSMDSLRLGNEDLDEREPHFEYEEDTTVVWHLLKSQDENHIEMADRSGVTTIIPNHKKNGCHNNRNNRNRNRRKQKCQIEASSDEGSDCEIMISSV